MPGKTKPEDHEPLRDPEQLKNLLIILEHARADAWLRRDIRALEPLLAPDFVEINHFGRFTRDDLLTRLFPHFMLHTFTIRDPALHQAGDGTATLTYQCYEDSMVDKKRINGIFHVSALYRWNGKQWKLALWKITPFNDR